MVAAVNIPPRSLRIWSKNVPVPARLPGILKPRQDRHEARLRQSKPVCINQAAGN